MAISLGLPHPTVLLNRLMPFREWLPMVNGRNLRIDLTAGLTGAIVVLPQGVAFATIAGMPPEYGLYAGMIPAVIAALFGSSWHLVSGPTTAASIVIFSSISVLAEPGSPEYVGLVLTLTFLVGCLELLMGLLRMGVLVSFISHTVALGFTAGAAILIAANQVKYFLGVPIPRGTPFYEVVEQVFTRFNEISPETLLVGVTTLAVGFLFKRFLPKVPYMIMGMAAGSVAALVINRYFGGSVETMQALPASLPPLSAPHFSLELIRELAPTVLAVTLFALTEAVSIARALAIRSDQQINGSQEFIGQGLSNIAGAFFSGYVATGSFNRSGLNFASGAKTPIAAISAGLILMAVVVLVAPLAAYLPKAAMAAILFMVAAGLIDMHHIKKVIRSSKAETTVMAVTFGSALFLDLEIAILSGVLLSLFLYLMKTSRPTILTRVPNPENPRGKFTTDDNLPECPQLKIVRIDGSLFFGAVPYVMETLRRRMKENPTQKNLAIVCSGINFLDVAGAEALANEARRLRRNGGRLYLIRPKGGALVRLLKGGYVDAMGEDALFFSKTEALKTIYSQLNPSICETCTKRIFRECNPERTATAPTTDTEQEEASSGDKRWLGPALKTVENL